MLFTGRTWHVEKQTTPDFAPSFIFKVETAGERCSAVQKTLEKGRRKQTEHICFQAGGWGAGCSRGVFGFRSENQAFLTNHLKPKNYLFFFSPEFFFKRSPLLVPPVINFSTSNTSWCQALNFLYPLLGDSLFLSSAEIIFEVGAWLLTRGAAQLLAIPSPSSAVEHRYVPAHTRAQCLPASY